MPTALEQPFSLDHFNLLGFPKKTLKELKPLWMDAIFLIHAVFVKHKMFDNFVLALIHRHHDLLDNERLVEVLNSDSSITSVEIPSTEDEILSHIWEVNDGKLLPFEYFNLSKSTGFDLDAFREAHKHLMNCNDFVAELSDVLSATGTSHLLGLQLSHRNALLKPNESLSEESYEHPRQSIVTSVVTAPACNVPVSWSMRPEATFCENCIPDWVQCGADPDLENPRKLACSSSNCGCTSCKWTTDRGHILTH